MSEIEHSDMELMQHFDGDVELTDLDDEARDKVATMALAGELLREIVDADDRADGIADAVMAALDDAEDLGDESPASRERAIAAAPPANDNSRRIYMIATAAAAVAAGFFFWGNTEPDQQSVQSAPAAATVAEAALPPPPAAETLDDAVGAIGSTSEDDALGVEIAAVDFGNQSGSVFYVPDEAGTATAVVWVTDAEEDAP